MWGWEPRTVHEYDVDGRMVASTPEPEYDRSQYELLAALEEYEADLGPHGQLMSEATSPDADPGNVNCKFIFKASDLPLIDYAARARDTASAAYYEKYPDVNRAGHLWLVRKVTR